MSDTTFDVLSYIDNCIDDASIRLRGLHDEIASLRESTKDGERDRTEDVRRQATNMAQHILDLRDLRKQFYERLATDKIERRGSLLGLMRDMQANQDKYGDIMKRSVLTNIGAQITCHKWRQPHPDNFEGGSKSSQSDPYFMGWMPGDDE